MFAPRPDVTAAELIRVTKPGGLIAMANWTPEAFTGQMFKTTRNTFRRRRECPRRCYGEPKTRSANVFRRNYRSATDASKDHVHLSDWPG